MERRVFESPGNFFQIPSRSCGHKVFWQERVGGDCRRFNSPLPGSLFEAHKTPLCLPANDGKSPGVC